MEPNSAPYTVIARRFRPQRFDDVVGQQPVARALKNAIQQDRVAHAYLFTGARGVGKTSMARILAKALNCPNVVDGNPCNECDLCRNISAGQDVDVSEIDGASNRGIDDIRQLRANVNVRSMRTRYKMYIIDEVHMLTKEAFNALLKTLEEPPPGVKFVFCTTEPNKVPDTILSRCQRFDFATIETQNIIARLQEIAAAEGYDVDPAAVELVARRANGSMRDSQSLFDQLLAFGSRTIVPEDVHRLLGTASDDRLIAMVQSLVERQRSTALELLDDALGSGVQLSELVDQVLYYLRDLMVLAAGAQSVPLVAVSGECRDRLLSQASQWGLRTVLTALEILAEAKGRMFRSGYARALVEMALVRITLLQDLDRLDDLIASLKSGVALPAPARLSVSPAVGGSPPPPSGVGHGAAASAPVSPPRATDQRSGLTPNDQKKNISEPVLTPRVEVRPTPVTAPAPTASADVEGPLAAPKIEWVAGREREIWTAVTDQIQDLLKTHARAATSIAISGPNDLDLSFPKSYHFSKQYCEQTAANHRLEQLVESVVGRPVRIRCRITEEAPVVDPKVQSQSVVRRRIPETVDDPFVSEAMTIFGASIAQIQTIGTSQQEGPGTDVP